MSTTKRRNYTPQEKVEILRRHLLEGMAVSDVCDEYGLNPNVFYRWQKEFFEHGAVAFNRPRTNGKARKERHLAEMEARLQKKDNVIAEIMAELIAEKKRHGVR